MTKPTLCPCGSANKYQNCCQPLHLKKAVAQTPEQLMRSRYTAFVLKEFQYLMDTHAEDFWQARSVEELSKPPHPEWIGLNVINSSESQNTGTVTFIAWYKADGQLDAIHEQSNFQKIDGLWYYTDGEHLKVPSPKRNDSCICNSGKKFKKCCGA
ncbi:YchJ family protein [Shewanella sp. 202IG2-18]|uniref:YchJ family protein n=1 Tax=Parashewanella hymeniacidonis TaxID=2807618 RepID=UPI00195FD765|nr:YchJ family protein [Parashewanella hymeniacidonis]MBM7070700.1 YchJ family protein [Parashewanella hymeniacidonis]